LRGAFFLFGRSWRRFGARRPVGSVYLCPSMSTGIPAPRDDDPEEVSDKLSIAAAMWARGETADAISWLRRAAASAADAEADDRALELAKAAADLTTTPAQTTRASMGMTIPTGTKPTPASQVPPSRPPTN